LARRGGKTRGKKTRSGVHGGRTEIAFWGAIGTRETRLTTELTINTKNKRKMDQGRGKKKEDNKKVLGEDCAKTKDQRQKETSSSNRTRVEKKTWSPKKLQREGKSGPRKG